MPQTTDFWAPYFFQQWYIPDRMMGGLKRYVEDHIAPGDFLMAVLTNNLSEAVGRADEENMANLPAYVAFLHNQVPANCWGNPLTVHDWLKERKL